jgi:hypothetical protein
MVIRTKLFWKAVSIVAAIGSIALAVQDILSGDATLKAWTLLLLSPWGILIMCFIVPTLRIDLSEDGIGSYWYVGFPFKKIWERERFLGWSDVEGAFMLTPRPFISMYGISGGTGRRRETFTIGAFTTDTKQALLFIADHVRPDAIHPSIRDRLAQYRQDLNVRVPAGE